MVAGVRTVARNGKGNLIALLHGNAVDGAGGALFGFACDDAINQIREKRGFKKEDNLVLWIVFGILFPLVTGALVQDAMNKLIDGQGTPKDPEVIE